MTDAITTATFAIDLDDLSDMMLDREDLPQQFHDFMMTKDGPLDNDEFAEGGFPDSTGDEFREAGRISGYVREFVRPPEPVPFLDGADFVASTAVHLFDDSESVFGWINDVFIKKFDENVGRDLPHEQRITQVDRMNPSGFYHEAAALRVLYDVAGEQVSSTIVDFRLGRLLGVAFVLTLGDAARLALAQEAASALERKMVGRVLG